MTRLDGLEDAISDLGIERHSQERMPGNVEGMSFREGGDIGVIILSKSLSEDKKEEMRVLSHELWHLLTGSMYGLYCSDRKKIENMESKADRASIRWLVPEEVLFNGLYVRMEPIAVIANDLGVTDETVAKAYSIYSHGQKWAKERKAIIYGKDFGC